MGSNSVVKGCNLDVICKMLDVATHSEFQMRVEKVGLKWRVGLEELTRLGIIWQMMHKALKVLCRWQLLGYSNHVTLSYSVDTQGSG